MKATTFKQTLNTLNLLIITTFLVLSLYSALGQQIFPFVGQYRADIENYISEQLDSEVNIRTLTGDMNIFTPSIHLEGVTLKSSAKQSLPSLSIAAIDAVLDPQASLINLAPVFKSVRISGLSIFISENEKPDINASQDNSAVIKTFIETLLLQQNVELNNVTVEFTKNNEVQRLELDNLSMTGDGFNRLMTGSILFGSENPIKAGIRIYSEGSPYKLDTFYARGILDLPKLEVDYWLEKVLDISVFDSFNASSQVSVEFKNGLLNYAKLNLASTKVAIPGVKAFKNVNAELWLKQKNVDTWALWLADSSFSLDDTKWSLDDLALKLSKTELGNRWQGFIKNADIQYIYDLVSSLDVMPEAIEDIYRDLMPSGGIQNFNVIVQQSINKDEPDTKFTLAGELKGVSTKAYNSIPALSNITGVIAANKDSGRVQFQGKDMEVDFPNLYHNPFEIIKGKGQVDWSLGEQGIKVVGNGIDFKLPGVESLRGGFDLLLPKTESGKTGSFELNLSANNTNVSAHPILIPKVIPDSLNNWINNALQGGVIKSGQFYYYDSIGNGHSNPNLEVYLDAQDGTLQYLEDWPKLEKLKGKVFVDNNDVYGHFNSAETLGGIMSSSQIRYLSGNEPYLWVEGEATGSSSELFSYLKDTPLSSAVNNVFDKWDMRGTHKSWIGLKAPMNGDLKKLKADVKTTLNSSDLQLNDINITVDNINGPLRYSTHTGLSSPKITAQFWGENIESVISSEMYGRNMKSDIKFSGAMNSSRLKDWLKLSLLEPVSGKSHVDGSVIVDTRENKFSGLTFNSELKGLSVNLPGKFAKKSTEVELLKGTFEFKDGQILKLSYGERANLAMKLNAGRLIAGQVFVGKTEAYIPSEPGVIIDGHLAKVNLNDWLDTWDLIGKSKYSVVHTSSNIASEVNESVDLSNSTPANQDSNPIRLMNVSTDMFEYNGFKFENVKSIIRQKNNIWEFDIDAPVANGVITLENKQPIKVELEYFHWPVIAANDEAENTDPLMNVDPKIFPLMKIEVDEIFLGTRNLGDWNVSVTPVKDGVKFTEIDGLIKKMKVKGDVTWIKPDDIKLVQTTQANLILTSDNVAGIQKAWRIKPAIEAKYGKINGSVFWNGSPAHPLISSVSGNVDLQFKNGRFIDAAEAGSLSAFGLLNFSAIGRRLRLDFSDIYQSGFHFDTVKGKTNIKNGVIKVIDTFEINGPSAKFASSGIVDLNTKEVNQELSATFPVTGTLPLIAIIAGFAPPVAASLFVGERLMGAEIEKYTSATYKLTGTWDQPKLDLMKRFDNNIEGKQDKNFWNRMKDFFGVGED